METIWKFRFDIVSPLRLSMPRGARILAVQDQDGAACMWAIVDPEEELESRYFEIYGTGQPMHRDVEADRFYVATFQQPPYVWHIFERK